jgi:hypothetical protein
MDNFNLNRKAIKKAYNKKVIEENVLKRLPSLPPSFDLFLKTRYVSKKNILDIKKLNIDTREFVKIKVDPFLVRNNCHWNCSQIQEMYPDDFKIVIGYNLTACPCSAFYSLEIHSVLQLNDGTYIDLTTDMAGETEKWFLPVRILDRSEKVSSLIMFAKQLEIENFSNMRTHNCPKKKGVRYDFPENISEKQFQNGINIFKSLTIIPVQEFKQSYKDIDQVQV